MSSRDDRRRRDRSPERDGRDRGGNRDRDRRGGGGGGGGRPRSPYGSRRDRSRSPHRRSDRDRDSYRDRDRRDTRDNDRRDRRDDRRGGDGERTRDRSKERDRDWDRRDKDRDRKPDNRDDRGRRTEDRETAAKVGNEQPSAPSASSSRPSNGPPARRVDLDPDSKTPEEGEEEETMDAIDDDEAAMRAMMGFGGFDSTKGKAVSGNEEGAAQIKKMRTWRQYMNRRGGFNRPLDKIK